LSLFILEIVSLAYMISCQKTLMVEDTLYCSGQIALVPCTMQLASGGIKKEALMSLNHVERVLKAMNLKAELHHVLMANCYITDSKYISVAEAVWQRKLKELTKVCIISYFFYCFQSNCLENAFIYDLK
uniref:Uncharacterized protein n=1 Tax=Pseudonaja textilis TaxID=8673 RepID=A0A670XVZ7_PSETE